ncbi:hypothetical protein CEE36_10905 [candidate division TA06 bacterium B3_TA06]|uniref:Uncharacterized protein n=1 Tax=candidate division TA06 bacterium B3_TA06 TaxID=2012487 RepID=A0A532USH2_UNCT6|nr:MAG: hypothetical protein CEE36_10905 [candidate division TA06 bacterium B3_TA06]
MKSVLRIGLMLIPVLITLIASDCKKEHRLRVYNNGVFEHKINITGWDVNEDLVKLGGFYYPWQGEDSIDYRGCYFCEGKKYVERGFNNEVQHLGKREGFRYSEDVCTQDTNILD